MQGFCRMDKKGRCTGAGERRGNFLTDMPGFTNACDDHFAFTLNNGVGCTDKIIAQPFWQAAGFLELQH
ncbi:hypothetical protein D3C80_1576760 [compost metagenome]